MNNKNAVQVSLTSIFAALYAVCVVALAPIGFQVFQVRFASVHSLNNGSTLKSGPTVIGRQHAVGSFKVLRGMEK